MPAALEDGRASKQEAAGLRALVDRALAACTGLRGALDERLERADPLDRADQ